ncbi:MAG: hypothetical protein U0528_10355 [Anaerolineae bacterium]
MQLFPLKERGKIDQVFTEVETSLGAYVRGVVFVCTFVGVANFILMRIFVSCRMLPRWHSSHRYHHQHHRWIHRRVLGGAVGAADFTG